MRVVILSAGSEIIATALAEEFLLVGIPIAVISLGKPSLLRNVSPDVPYAEINWPPESTDVSAIRLLEVLDSWGASASSPWPVFATEDGGLRLLFEYRSLFQNLCMFGQARRLQLGGLDKAELFSYLSQHGCANVISPTITIKKLEELASAISDFGCDCVIKPAIKPFSMRMNGMKTKVFMTRGFHGLEDLKAHLNEAWNISSCWVVQPRLHTPEAGEAVFWALRDTFGNTTGLAAVEQFKHPKEGGTACLVETRNNLVPQLLPLAKLVLDAIDFVGTCELPFLKDPQGQWRLLELNPRPWLQVALARTAGCPMGIRTVEALRGNTIESLNPRDEVSWANIERILLASISTKHKIRFTTLIKLIWSLSRVDTLAIYSTRLPYVRTRWLIRMLSQVIK